MVETCGPKLYVVECQHMEDTNLNDDTPRTIDPRQTRDM